MRFGNQVIDRAVLGLNDFGDLVDDMLDLVAESMLQIVGQKARVEVVGIRHGGLVIARSRELRRALVLGKRGRDVARLGPVWFQA